MRRYLFVLIAIALVTAACTETPVPTEPSPPVVAASPSDPPAPNGDEFASARANFAQHCVECHGENADGGVVKIKDKQIKVPSLKKGHALKHSDEEFKNTITNGEQAMPPFNEMLSEAEIMELVRFIRKEVQGR